MQNRTDARLLAVFWMAVWIVVVTAEAGAIGEISYQNPEEHVLGYRGASTLMLSDRLYAPRQMGGWSAEVGESFPFGMSALRTVSTRIALARKSWGVVTSGVGVTSPVGSEVAIAVESFLLRARSVRLSVGVDFFDLAFDNGRGTRLVTASVRSFLPVSNTVTVGYTVEKVRVAGFRLSGTDTALYLSLIDTPLSASIVVDMRRDGSIGIGAASFLRIADRLRAAFGYEEQTSLLKTSVSLGVSTVNVSVGVTHHPVLGLSESVFVGWRR